MLKRPRSPVPSSPTVYESNVQLREHKKRRRAITPEPVVDDEGDSDERDVFMPQRKRSADSPYKSTNSVLHELHTLSRHRQLFSTKSDNDRRPEDPPDEPHSVHQRYEDTNRLLGSLFLSRRRDHADPEDQ